MEESINSGRFKRRDFLAASAALGLRLGIIVGSVVRCSWRSGRRSKQRNPPASGRISCSSAPTPTRPTPAASANIPWYGRRTWTAWPAGSSLHRVLLRGAALRPARASLFSGMFPSDVESYCNATPFRDQVPTWGNCLHQHGYYCMAMGKMDLSGSGKLGFEEVFTTHGHVRSPDVTAPVPPPAMLSHRRSRKDRRSSDRAAARGRAGSSTRSFPFLTEKARQTVAALGIYVGFMAPLALFHHRQAALRDVSAGQDPHASHPARLSGKPAVALGSHPGL